MATAHRASGSPGSRRWVNAKVAAAAAARPRPPTAKAATTQRKPNGRWATAAARAVAAAARGPHGGRRSCTPAAAAAAVVRPTASRRGRDAGCSADAGCRVHEPVPPCSGLAADGDREPHSRLPRAPCCSAVRVAPCAADRRPAAPGRGRGPGVGALRHADKDPCRAGGHGRRAGRRACAARAASREVVIDDGPLVLVETRKDLSQLKLPFETGQPPSAAPLSCRRHPRRGRAPRQRRRGMQPGGVWRGQVLPAGYSHNRMRASLAAEPIPPDRDSCAATWPAVAGDDCPRARPAQDTPSTP